VSGRRLITEVTLVAVVWLVITVALLAIELHHMAFFALFGAVGAAAAGIVAAATPDGVAAQLAVFLVVTALGVVLVRPYVSRVFERHSHGVRIAGVHGGLIGARGMTVDIVGTEVPGHVRLLGEQWLATAPGGAIEANTPVIITHVVGTTLVVQPASSTKESA
jgi:membrane protein implicated in regulation of membrane protease activity